MRLYHMTTFDTAVKFILPERRMRLSRLDKLNDPFELRSLKLEGTRAKRIFAALLAHFISDLGVLCMVKNWASPLMWAHYADNHAGVCLGFDVPDDKPRQMEYVTERRVHVLDETDPHGGITHHDLDKLLITKSSGWSYEEEWRLFSQAREPDPVNGYFYLPFENNIVLREVIVGSCCAAPVGSFKKLLAGLPQSVTIIKARPAFETFTMVRQKQVSAITVMPK